MFVEFLRKKTVIIPLGVIFIALFWFVYLGRLIYHFWILGGRGYAGHNFIFYFQQGILGCAIPSIAIGIVAKRLIINRLFRNIKKIALLTTIALLYIVSKEIGFSMNIFIDRVGFGEDGGVINPIIMSQYGGFIAFVFLYSLINTGFKLFDVIFFFFGMALLILGASRGPILAYVVVLVIYFLYQLKMRFKSVHLWKYIFLVLGFLVWITVQYVIPNIQKFMILRRMENVSRGKDLSGDIRKGQWSAAWHQFLEHPIFGDNIVEKYMHFYPHNSILEILMATGIIGGLFYMAAMFKFSYSFIYIKDKQIRFFLYSMILFLFYSLFSLGVIDISQFWCLFAFGVGITKMNIK